MSSNTDVPATTADTGLRARRRRAITSAWAGFAIDSYSIYVASTSLLPAMVYFQANLSPSQLSVFVGMTFAATLLGRPVGALLFGHFADRIGRRKVGSITIYGFGTISLLIALLPGAELVGAGLATALLIGLRFIEGIFLGGEYTAATPMALEYAPKGRRGFTGALIQCSASGGPFVVAVVTTLVLVFAPNAGLHSPYVQWGWRIPFLIGAVLSWLVAWFLRRRVEDSDVWKETATTKSPLRDMLRGASGRAFVQSYVIMTGVFFAVNMLGSVMPQLLLSNKGFTASDLAHTQLINAWPGMATYLFYGWLSDRIGRKRALYIAATTTVVLTPVTLTLMGGGHVHGWLQLTVLASLTNVFIVGSLGVLPAYINERFATAVRSSGWGVAYSTAVIIPAFFSYYQLWLSKLVPFAYTAGILSAFGGLLILLAVRSGPETRGVDLNTVGEKAVAQS
ncbi:Nitrate/nitrite transporter NarK [Amycolatopsis sacchari]|uniref:Nitrate/nitrite transporter NarK n=1 Tax=Amycolatopsis sacchari TaxID=115433 RepID=A0A1I3T046_9PSEU|nr:MFS transporter [Amycolatopsis sacchari]SFJ64013.1 Nitrate/nitrite transporter NarK [Amycolatopsis sacchari]